MQLRSRTIRPRVPVAVSLLALAACIAVHPAQAQSPESAPAVAHPAEVTQTVFLVHAYQQNDLNDIQTDLRNVIPTARIFGVASQLAITVRGTAEDVAQAQKLIAELDRPRARYRLTYTFTEKDGGRTVGTRRVSMIVLSGSKSTLKMGSRVPVVTGSTGTDTKSPETNVQYIDVGLNIDATLEGRADDLGLRTKVEQSGVADEKPTASAQDPIIRQTTLESSAALTQDKPLLLGSLDMPGTTHLQEVEVVAELVR